VDVKADGDDIHHNPHDPVLDVLLRKHKLSDEAHCCDQRVQKRRRVFDTLEVIRSPRRRAESNDREDDDDVTRRPANLELGMATTAKEPHVPAEETQDGEHDLKRHVPPQLLFEKQDKEEDVVRNPDRPVPNVLLDRQPHTQSACDEGEVLGGREWKEF